MPISVPPRLATLALAVALALGVSAPASGQVGPSRPPAPRPIAKPAPDAPPQPGPPGKRIRPTIKLKLPKPPAPATPPPPHTGPGAARWTEPTAEAMVNRGFERARVAGDDALAGLLVGVALRHDAPADLLPRSLGQLAKVAAPIGHEARAIQAALAPPPFGRPWEGWAKARFDGPAQQNGVVRAFAILGPLQDTGGGLERAEGPEAPGQRFDDAEADYSWGAYEVRWRRTLFDTAGAAGVPLDLYVAPRNESCSILASKVAFPKTTGPVVARVASSGAVRLVWDGATVATSDEVHARALVDRLAVRIEPSPGAHLVAVKVCSGAIADEGRVRVRFTDEAGAPILVESSSDLAGLAPDRARPVPAPAADKARKATKPATGAPRRVPTLLEEATTLGEGASRHDVLAAAVVRSLGGADDLRSPRAPGLLDRVAKDPAVTADELALAGWMSTFGANKSGWLFDARARAERTGDAATASFAARRQVEAHLAGNRIDAALATLSEAPLAGAGDLDVRRLRAEVRGRAPSTASKVEALSALIELDAGLRQRTPIDLLVELRNLSGHRPEAALAYQRRLAAASTLGRDARYAVASALEGAGAFERAVAVLLTHQTHAGALVDLGRELDRLGRHAWAREVLYTATRLSPNLPEAWSALASARDAVLADELRAGATPTDDPRHAEAARQRAIDLRPADPRAKAELAFRARRAADTEVVAKETQPDERFLAAPRTILDRVRARPAEKGKVFERQAHFQRVVTYHPDQRVSQLIHYAREIVVEPRTQGELVERDIPAEGDQVELVLARLHRPDGTVVQPEEQSAEGAYVKWSELRTGDVIEIAVRSWTSGPVGRRGDAPFYFIDYVGSTSTRPVLFNEVIVDAPIGAELGLDVIGGKPDREETTTEGARRIRRFTWDAPPNLPDEPLMPRPTEVLPIVVGSTYPSWDAFREWYRGAVKGFSEPDEQVKRIAAELTKGKKTEEEKLRALFDFVADDIRYVNYVSGEWWLPNRPQQCLARRQGDCDDKAMLLIALLRSIGVEATPVLVQTRMTGMPNVLSSQKAAIPMFDHGIAYLPGKNGKPGVWLDATSPQSRLGPLPSMDARARALFVEQGKAEIVVTPASSPDEHGASLSWTVELGPTGAGRVKGEEKHLGDWAFHLRNNLVEPDARAQWVEQYLSSRWLPTVDLGETIRYEPDRGVLGYEVASEAFARREGDELAVPVFGSFSFTSNLAPLTKRTLPVVLPPQLAPSHQRRTMTLVAPPGFAFGELPPGGEAKGGPFGAARVSFQKGKRPDTLVVEASIVFDQSTISAAEYPAFRAWLQSADAIFRQTVRLAPQATAAPKAAPARAGR